MRTEKNGNLLIDFGDYTCRQKVFSVNQSVTTKQKKVPNIQRYAPFSDSVRFFFLLSSPPHPHAEILFSCGTIFASNSKPGLYVLSEQWRYVPRGKMLEFSVVGFCIFLKISTVQRSVILYQFHVHYWPHKRSMKNVFFMEIWSRDAEQIKDVPSWAARLLQMTSR